ncbi:OmpA family protein [Thiosocius teredinicola]|uniref:OmpA family protein n=1 Tax=Thiosocius teredinicola TaxID=1973002 RepID=UPI000990BB69
MRIRVIRLAVLMAAALGVSQVQAGYWTDSSGEVWRNSAGECWRTGSWTPEDIIVGCDGKVAEVAEPEPAAPAPAPAPAPAAVTTEATVTFGFDSADLDQEAMSSIDTLVNDAQGKGKIQTVRLTGHADRIGTEEYNLDLSLRRASAVNDYLVNNKGIDPQAIEISGKGESMPVVGCEGVRGSEAITCLRPNRRVEVDLDLF